MEWKTIYKMSKSKLDSFEKINKIGKLLGRLIKKRKWNIIPGMIEEMSL